MARLVVHFSTNGETACGLYIYGTEGDGNSYYSIDRTMQHSCDVDFVTCKSCLKTRQVKDVTKIIKQEVVYYEEATVQERKE